jgi:uncharacterized protein (TIGR02145 family)
LKRLLYLLLFFTLSFQGFSQIDKEFWFVAPEVSSNHGDSPIYMRISTMNDTANIMLRMPADLSFGPITQMILPNSSYSIDMTPFKETIEDKPANTVLNKGLLLTSDKDVTAYYEVANASNPAVSSLKGKNAVGTEFYISSQTDYQNQTNDGSEAFDIVATEDKTTIIITPTWTVVGHPANVPYQVILDKGQTFSVRTMDATVAASLAGSHVVSDKPIAITIFDDSIITGGWDEIADQTIPVNLLGTTYIVIKGFADNNPPSNDDERAYILASKDHTDLYLNGSSMPVTTLSAGQQYDYPFPSADNTLALKASQPVYVYHLSGHPGEAGSAILPQDSCTGSKRIGFTRTTNQEFAMLILTRNGNQDSFYLNGNNSIITAANFSIVPGTGNAWVYYRQNLLSTTQVPVGANQVWNTMGKFHLGILNKGSGGSSEYGYFSDFSSLYLGADRSICPGDSVLLDGGYDRQSYEWKKDVSGIWTLVGNSRYLVVRDSGYYACMTNGDFCELRDTIHIGIYPNAIVMLGPDTTICQGASITLDPGPFVSYLWQNGSTTRYMITATPGLYWVKVVNNNGCAARDTVVIALDSVPHQPGPITGSPEVCQGQNGVIYQVSATTYAENYIWTLPIGMAGTSTTNSILIDFSAAAITDTLRVRGNNVCGYGPESKMKITVDPLPGPAKPISGPSAVCQGQAGVTFSVEPSDNATSYIWSFPSGATIVTGAGTNSVTVNFSISALPGTISVQSQNSCGISTPSTMHLGVDLLPVPAGSITGPQTVCPGQSGITYTVPAITGADTYVWTFPAGATITGGAGTNTITVSFSTGAADGTVSARGHSNNCGDGIPSSLAVTVHPFPSQPGPVSGSIVVCQGQSNVPYSINPVPNAESYSWTLPSGYNGSAATESIAISYAATALSDTILVKGINYCGEGPARKLGITVDPLPVAAGTITGPSPVCQGQGGVIYSLPAVDHATSYVWTLTPGATVVSGSGTNSITLSIGLSAAPGTLQVYGHNYCGDGASSSFPLQVDLFPVPAGSITGPAIVCQGQRGITYTVPVITGADSYVWNLPSGAMVTGGSGTGSITVKFDSATAVSGNITVRGHSNACGDGISSTFPVTVNPLPVPAGSISGQSPVCQSQSGVTYTVPLIGNATSYVWTVPTGATIVSGASTNSIVVNFSSSASTGNFTVKGTNTLCGDGLSSSDLVQVNPLPAAAGSISGPNPVCQSQSNALYAVPLIQYASVYLWNFTGTGGTLTNSGSSATISFNAVATSGTLTVTGQNSCGTGTSSPVMAITVNPIPIVSVNICNTLLTRDAQPFHLRGGIPTGGTFSGTGVSGSLFNPAIVPAFQDTAIVRYSYTNVFGCTSRSSQVITVLNIQPFSCGNTLTDVRDSKTYPTVKIGTQCWMAVNLEYGNAIPYSINQFDNCIPERYINPASSIQHPASGYQWDELMQYETTSKVQGLCPPGWHVPDENDWTTLMNQFSGNGFAGSPLKYTGYSGFNIYLNGVTFLNHDWNFTDFATFIWSSTLHGETKAWAHGMNTPDPSISLYPAQRSDAFSARCIKD